MISTLVRCLVVLVALSFSMPAMAMKRIILSPNETKLLTNSLMWTLQANCKIQGTKSNLKKIKIMVLKNKGVINGRPLSSGQSTTVQLQQIKNVSVSADSGTQIHLTNLSSEQVHADCGSI